jgi:hypothetical protein
MPSWAAANKDELAHTSRPKNVLLPGAVEAVWQQRVAGLVLFKSRLLRPGQSPVASGTRDLSSLIGLDLEEFRSAEVRGEGESDFLFPSASSELLEFCSPALL